MPSRTLTPEQKEKNRLRAERWRKANPNAKKEWRQARLEEQRAASRSYMKENKGRWATGNHPGTQLARSRNYRAAKLRAPGKLSRQDWAAILELYGHRCRNCASTGRLQADHIVPLSKGGTNGVDNHQPLCKVCNVRKHNRLWPHLA